MLFRSAQGMVAQLGVVVGMGLMSSVQASAPGSAGFAWAYVCALVMAVTGALGAAALRDAAPALEPALLS